MRLFVSLMIVGAMAGCARKEQLTPHDEKIVAELKGLYYGEFLKAFDVCADSMAKVRTWDDLYMVCGDPALGMYQEGKEYSKVFKQCSANFQRSLNHPCWMLEVVLCRRDKLRAQLDLPVGERASLWTTGPWTAPNPYGDSGKWDSLKPTCYPPLEIK